VQVFESLKTLWKRQVLTFYRTLYSQFVSPFADPPTTKIPEPPEQVLIPSCYTLPQPPPPPLSKITSFSDETLLYIFYALPSSSLSEAAATELYARAWRYHKELQMWITKEPEMVPTRTAAYEKGVFWVFDSHRWERERREMTVRYDDLEEMAQQVPMLNMPLGMIDRMMNIPSVPQHVSGPLSSQGLPGLSQGLGQLQSQGLSQLQGQSLAQLQGPSLGQLQGQGLSQLQGQGLGQLQGLGQGFAQSQTQGFGQSQNVNAAIAALLGGQRTFLLLNNFHCLYGTSFTQSLLAESLFTQSLFDSQRHFLLTTNNRQDRHHNNWP
jgi:hypothetical protein